MGKEFKNTEKIYNGIPPKEKAKELAAIWGEGYAPLTNLLEFCISNGIRTIACCSGHEEEKELGSYIYFENQGEISNYLIDQMLKDASTNNIGVDRHNYLKVPSFFLECKYEDRKEFFETILQHLQEYTQNKTQESEKNSEALMLKKIMELTKNKYYKLYLQAVEYSPKTKLYDAQYTEEEMKQKDLDTFLMGEGYEPLTNILEIGSEQGIEIYVEASKKEKYASISLKQEDLGAFLVEKMKQEKTIDYIEVFHNDFSQDNDFYFFCKYEDREEFCKQITQYLQQYSIHKNTATEEKKKDETAETMIQLAQKYNCTIYYDPKTKFYGLVEDQISYSKEEVIQKCLEEEKQQGDQGLDNKRKEKEIDRPQSAIEKIKDICSHTKTGINRIGELFRKFQEIIKLKRQGKEKILENAIDEEDQFRE